MRIIKGDKYNRLIIFLILIYLIPAVSCKSYPEVIINKRLFNNTEKKSNSANDILKRYKIYTGDEKSYPAENHIINNVNYKRYFADNTSFSPLSVINKKGIEYALKGQYTEARILFNELLKEDNGFAAAYNNLGIIYEFSDNNNMAFEMYSKACIKDPGNEFYRWNFMNFCDKKPDKMAKEDKEDAGLKK